MKNRVAYLAALLAIALAGARAAGPQESDAAVIAALNKFADLLETGDAKAVEHMIYAEFLSQDRLRGVLAQLAVAEKSLERIALSRFGDEGKRFRCGFDLI